VRVCACACVCAVPEAEGDGERGAVLALGDDLAALADQAGLAGPQVALDVLVVVGSVGAGHEHVDVVAQQLFFQTMFGPNKAGHRQHISHRLAHDERKEGSGGGRGGAPPSWSSRRSSQQIC
jgi:hypothetical protein